MLAGAIKKAADIAPPTEATLVPPLPHAIIQRTVFSVSTPSPLIVCSLLIILLENPSLRLSSSTTISSFRQSKPISRAASVGSGSQTSIDEKQGLSEKPHFPLETIAIRISGLRNKLTAENYGSATFSHVVRVPSDTAIERLGDCLLEEQPSK